MIRQTTTDEALAASESRTYERFASVSALVAGLAALLYAIAFVVLRSTLLSGLFLMFIGLLASSVVIAIYNRVRKVEANFAFWALLLGIAGALGSAVHGGYDLANALNTPVNSVTQTIVQLPNPVDPRGLLTFGVTALSVAVFAWLIGQSNQFSHWLSYWGYLLAILLIILYLGRLILFSPTNPVVLVPVLLSGFIVSPIWYFWLGLTLWRPQTA